MWKQGTEEEQHIPGELLLRPHDGAGQNPLDAQGKLWADGLAGIEGRSVSIADYHVVY